MTGKDSLANYRTKRNFIKTPEPKGITAKSRGHSYLIEKHAASRRPLYCAN